MRPSKAFSILTHAIDEHQLEYDRIISLPNESWTTICSMLELNAKSLAVSAKEGKQLVSVAVDKFLADVERGRADRAEVERDLRIAQGCRYD